MYCVIYNKCAGLITNGPTLHVSPLAWLPYVPESVEEVFHQIREPMEAILKGGVCSFLWDIQWDIPPPVYSKFEGQTTV